MPDVRDDSGEVAQEASGAEEDRYADLVLAGFRACAKEALRFLLEEEGLSPEHPLLAGLNEHLLKQQCHLAGTLHNDSGIDMEESFLTPTTDGDISPLSHNTDFEGSLLSSTVDGDTRADSVAACVMEMILSVVNYETEEGMCCENEDDYRTEILTRTPHNDR